MVPGDRGSHVPIHPGLGLPGPAAGRRAGSAHASPRAFHLLYFHATVLQAGGSRPQEGDSSSSPSRRRGQAAPPAPSFHRLPLDTIFKTFNIKVKFIILDPEKHFVRLRSSRCKQSTTGTKPAPRRRRPRLQGRMADKERGVPTGMGTGRVAGGPLPMALGGSATRDRLHAQPCHTSLLWE